MGRLFLVALCAGVHAELVAHVVKNTVEVGGQTFRVLPDVREYKQYSVEQLLEDGYVTQGKKPFIVPRGWAIVSRAAPDFGLVAEKVIEPYGWSAQHLAVRKGTADGEGFSAFYTKEGKAPGAVFSEDFSHVKVLGDGKYQVNSGYTRLLVRRQDQFQSPQDQFAAEVTRRQEAKEEL